jgi:hypothetical protein
MSAVAAELEKRLLELDADSASKLERVVRSLLEFSRTEPAKPSKNTQAWPEGYFESTAGSFEGERLDAPEDPPPAPATEW